MRKKNYEMRKICRQLDVRTALRNDCWDLVVEVVIVIVELLGPASGTGEVTWPSAELAAVDRFIIEAICTWTGMKKRCYIEYNKQRGSSSSHSNNNIEFGCLEDC